MHKHMVEVFKLFRFDIEVEKAKVTIGATEVARILYGIIYSDSGLERPDGIGRDWYTDDDHNVYICDQRGLVSENNRTLAALVDAANIVLTGRRLTKDMLSEADA